MSTLFHQLHADPWSTSLVDVASLNARASDAVLAAIDGVRGAAFGDAVARQTRSFLIVGLGLFGLRWSARRLGDG